MPGKKHFSVVIAATFAIMTLTACGFVGASGKSHIKPTGFLLYGHAAVKLPANDQRAPGTGCIAPDSASDVAPDTKVTVMDPAGKTIGTGALDNGVVARENDVLTCDFAFSIPAVPGGVDTYSIQIGSRAAQQFPAQALRQNTPAVITITP